MTSPRTTSIAAALLLAALLGPQRLTAQAADPTDADRPMATRPTLEAVASSNDGQAAARARQRLTSGDFRGGDRIWLVVQGDTALTDTFTVWPDQSVHLPSPTVGTLSLQGVLRSELQPKMQQYVARFVRNPDVRARPLMRVGISGEVRSAGYYAVPADAELSEVFMAAGGTTPNARMEKAKVQRDGHTILEGRDLQMAVAGGQTLNDVGVREGDQFVMPKKASGLSDGLRFTWLIMSVTLGAIALSNHL